MNDRAAVIVAFAFAFAVACMPARAADSTNPAESGKAAYESAYQHAQALAKKADGMDAAWTVTKPALESAQKAAKSGQYDEATKLADHAAALAQASIKQAEQQKTAWKAAVVR